MKTTRFSGFVFVALAMFAPPAAAQTPDGMTPAQEGICDDLADATPGLYGLCVAVCEAQDCKGTVDPATGDVTLDPSCSPSTGKLLANYRKLAGDPYATPSCIRPPCPCWSESEIDNVGRNVFFGLGDSCSNGKDGETVTLFGFSATGRTELAYALKNGHGFECMYQEENTPEGRDEYIGEKPFRTCQDSVRAQIASRELTCR